MKFVILFISLILSSVSASPAPQVFGNQPPNSPNWVTQGLQIAQGSLQSVSNALQNLPRPSFTQVGSFLNPFRPQVVSNQIPIGPNNFGQGQFPNGQIPNGQFPNGQFPNGQFPNGQIPNGQFPNGQIPNGQFPNGPFPNGQIPNGQFPNGQFPNGQFPNGQFQNNGPYPNVAYPGQSGPVFEQLLPPYGVPLPYNQADGHEKTYQMLPYPLIPHFGDPTIIIISRAPPKLPLSQNPSQINSTPNISTPIQPTNSSTFTTATPTSNTSVQNALAPQNMPSTSMPTAVPNIQTEPTLGNTATLSTENASNVSDLGLTMINPVSVPLAPIGTTNASVQTSIPSSSQ